MSQSYYIYPARKRVEIYSALFAGGFGVNIWSLGFTSEPLKWAGMGQAEALAFGLVISLAAVLHGVGVRVNGAWRWSPALRLVGMTVHALMFGYLAFKGMGQTAAYTYGWGAIILTNGALSAAIDLNASLGGVRWKTE